MARGPHRAPATPPVASLLVDAAAAHPGRAALAYGDQTLSFAELAGGADRLARVLDVEPGEPVAVVAPNAPALVVAMFAAWRRGAVPVPLSARLRGFELARAFADAQPAAAISVAGYAGFAVADEVESAGKDVPGLRTRIVLDEMGEVTANARCPPQERPGPLGPELATILYTSGTTGEAKGALIEHAMLVAGARSLAELLGEDAEAPFGLVVPASHAFGLACLLCGIAAGALAIMVEARTSLAPLTAALRAHRAAVLHGAPALFGRLLEADPPPLRTGLVAGSVCPGEVLEALEARGARILNLYGLTEVGCACACRPSDPPSSRYRTIGRPLSGYELRIAPADDPGAHTPDGELQVRSGYLGSGYLGRPWAPEEMDPEGWLATGDIAHRDAAGSFSIKGRLKEVVQVAGFNVYPAEVETFLVTHPGIAQAAVVGRRHAALGESLHAFVTPARAESLRPADVIRFAREGIASYKVPYAVSVVSELPLLPSGKPDRRELARSLAGRGVAARETAVT